MTITHDVRISIACAHCAVIKTKNNVNKSSYEVRPLKATKKTF